MAAVTETIANLVTVTPRYVRSVDIRRDLNDPSALEGYVLTPTAQDAAARVAAALRPGSTQRAFRLVGPYGSGKSAFGLFLACLLRERGDGSATRLLADAAPNMAFLRRWHPIVLVGRHAPFSAEVLHALVSTPPPVRPAQHLLDRAANLLAGRQRPDPYEVTGLLANMASDLRDRTGAGLLLIVDEMGRFLEHAAAHPLQEDPSFFQALAEQSAGETNADLAVFAILHQGFADYVAGHGAWIEAEWARVSARYEEIRFDGTTEQSLFLLSNAIQQPRKQQVAVRRRARTLFEEAVERGVFVTNGRKLSSISHSLYPLHPAALAALAAGFRRFGQNERSLFSFLQSLELYGFQRFARVTRYHAANWYRIPEVFDHLAATIPERPSTERAGQWTRALRAVHVAAGMPQLQQDVLKTVALIAVLEPVSGLRADHSTLAWCLDRPRDDVAAALSHLCSGGLVYRRTHRSDYSLWSNSSVDLSRWLDSAKGNVARPRRLEDVAAYPQKAGSLVAHRHYHETGTLRSFDLRLWTRRPPEPYDADGLILLAPVYPGENAEAVRTQAIRDAGDSPLTLICLRPVPIRALEWAHELSLWDWIRSHCPDLRVDDIARAEVAQQVEAATAGLTRLTTLLASPDTGSEDTWWSGTAPASLPGGRLSALLSDICDRVYDKAPPIRNEILNRRRLSSAAATARMRLLEAMLTNPTLDRLGIQGTPPELTMYLTIFHESGLHRPDRQGDFAFRAPTHRAWKPIWQHLRHLTSTTQPVSLDSLIQALSRPPFGLRAGPALPLIAAYALTQGDRIAFLERGTFVPELTGSHFMRIAKAPTNFALRTLAEPTGRQGLVSALARLHVVAPCRPSLVDVTAKTYRWFNQLTPFALQTGLVSPIAAAVREQLRKATDPADLFYRLLPDACGLTLSATSPATATTYPDLLGEALHELDQATSRLRARVMASILDAFAQSDVVALSRSLDRQLTPYRSYLHDHRLEVFVDRATRSQADPDTWLDGIAGHLVGKRPPNWTDRTQGHFDLEVRKVATDLAKWLALAQTAHGGATGLTSVHLIGIDGSNRTLALDPGVSQAVEDAMDAVRTALRGSAAPEQVLGRLLDEYLDRTADT